MFITSVWTNFENCIRWYAFRYLNFKGSIACISGLHNSTHVWIGLNMAEYNFRAVLNWFAFLSSEGCEKCLDFSLCADLEHLSLLAPTSLIKNTEVFNLAMNHGRRSLISAWVETSINDKSWRRRIHCIFGNTRLSQWNWINYWVPFGDNEPFWGILFRQVYSMDSNYVAPFECFLLLGHFLIFTLYKIS